MDIECSKCGVSKAREAFREGRRQCKECARADYKLWVSLNPERRKAINDRYEEAHPDRAEKYRAENPEYQKRYYEANRESELARGKRHRDANPERESERHKQWRAASRSSQNRSVEIIMRRSRTSPQKICDEDEHAPGSPKDRSPEPNGSRWSHNSTDAAFAAESILALMEKGLKPITSYR